MLLEDIYQMLPRDWYPMDMQTEHYKVIPLEPYSNEYRSIKYKIRGDYYHSIKGIYKVQNPFIYTKFAMKAYEYGMRGPYNILQLYHDTPQENAVSIVKHNFDWRLGGRCMFGPGVYFSVSPFLANKHSCRGNSYMRSMFLVDVLVQNVHHAQGEVFLPDFGFDTVLAHQDATYVKYFDCEYYPNYFVDYEQVIFCCDYDY